MEKVRKALVYVYGALVLLFLFDIHRGVWATAEATQNTDSRVVALIVALAQACHDIAEGPTTRIR